MSIRIRDFSEEGGDAAACVNIYNYYIANTVVTFEEELLSEDDFLQRARSVREHYPFLVAEDEGRVVGYVYLDRFHERTAYRYTADLSIYLDREYGGRGIGSVLLCRAEEAARAVGIRQLISLVTGDNRASILFHEKNGFSLCGTLTAVGYKFDRRLDVCYFQKAL